MKKICDPRKWPRVLQYGAERDLIVQPTPARLGYDREAWRYSKEIVAATGDVYCVNPSEGKVRYMLQPNEIQQLLEALQELDWMVELRSMLATMKGNNSTDLAPPVAKPEEAASEAALQYCLREAAAGRRVDYGEQLRRIGHERLRYTAQRRVEAEPVEQSIGDRWRTVMQKHQFQSP